MKLFPLFYITPQVLPILCNNIIDNEFSIYLHHYLHIKKVYDSSF